MNRLKIISLVALAGLDLAAGLFAGRSFVAVDGGDSFPARSAPTIVPAALSDTFAVTRGDDPETLARPLFVKTRRPWQGTRRASSVVSAAPPPSGLKLHAIVGFSHSARAFVTSSAAADGKWLGVGETFENWTVESISSQEIDLRLDADLLRVGLDYDNVATPAGPITSPAPSTPVAPTPAPPSPPPVISENLDK